MSDKNDQSTHFKVVQITKVNGLDKCEMALAFKHGQMVQNMRVIGKITKLMVEVNFVMLMEISMKVTGKMIKLMVKVFIFM